MKKLLLLSLILLGCAKKTPEPETPQQVSPITLAPKNVEIYITYGGVNNFASVKWSYDPEIDSIYPSTNSYNRTIKNTTTSDSILVYTNSGTTSLDNVTVYVNGTIKEQYTGSQTVKVIKL